MFKIRSKYSSYVGLPVGTRGKEPTCQSRRHKRRGFHPWPGRFPGGGHGNPLQYSCLENPVDRGAWWATAHRVTKNRTHTHIPPQGWLSMPQEAPSNGNVLTFVGKPAGSPPLTHCWESLLAWVPRRPCQKDFQWSSKPASLQCCLLTLGESEF